MQLEHIELFFFLILLSKPCIDGNGRENHPDRPKKHKQCCVLWFPLQKTGIQRLDKAQNLFTLFQVPLLHGQQGKGSSAPLC